MRVLHLTQGMTAKVDDEDYDKLSSYKWMAVKYRKHFYAAVWDKSVNPRKQVKMHRLILGVTDPKIFVDHKDGDGLNNMKTNIRQATPSQNKINVTPFGKSRFLGVYPTKHGKFRAGIVLNKKFVHLGNFDNEIEAAKKRDEASLIHHGEFAKLNIQP